MHEKLENRAANQEVHYPERNIAARGEEGRAKTPTGDAESRAEIA
jgi:hypothetical protein